MHLRGISGRLKREAVAGQRLPQHWIPARWERRIARKLGWVRAGPSYDSWDHWYPRDRVPEGYEVRGWSLSVPGGDA